MSCDVRDDTGYHSIAIDYQPFGPVSKDKTGATPHIASGEMSISYAQNSVSFHLASLDVFFIDC